MPNKYDATRYDPPAPIAEVSLHDYVAATIVDGVVMLLDTGADVTLLPRKAVDRLGTQSMPGEGVELMSFEGSRSVAPVVELDLIFLQKAIRGKYALIEADHGVIGRDVLCLASFVFDGPKQEWRLE